MLASQVDHHADSFSGSVDGCGDDAECSSTSRWTSMITLFQHIEQSITQNLRWPISSRIATIFSFVNTAPKEEPGQMIGRRPERRHFVEIAEAS